MRTSDPDQSQAASYASALPYTVCFRLPPFLMSDKLQEALIKYDRLLACRLSWATMCGKPRQANSLSYLIRASFSLSRVGITHSITSKLADQSSDKLKFVGQHSESRPQTNQISRASLTRSWPRLRP